MDIHHEGYPHSRYPVVGAYFTVLYVARRPRVMIDKIKSSEMCMNSYLEQNIFLLQFQLMVNDSIC